MSLGGDEIRRRLAVSDIDRDRGHAQHGGVQVVKVAPVAAARCAVMIRFHRVVAFAEPDEIDV